MSTLSIVGNHNFFGLLELDYAGTVLYCRLDSQMGSSTVADLLGSNFYTDVAPFLNVGEFRQRLVRFTQIDSPADSFIFDCQFSDGEVIPVRVLLARMRQPDGGDRTESMLVHIRKV